MPTAQTLDQTARQVFYTSIAAISTFTGPCSCPATNSSRQVDFPEETASYHALHVETGRVALSWCSPTWAALTWAGRPCQAYLPEIQVLTLPNPPPGSSCPTSLRQRTGVRGHAAELGGPAPGHQALAQRGRGVCGRRPARQRAGRACPILWPPGPRALGSRAAGAQDRRRRWCSAMLLPVPETDKHTVHMEPPLEMIRTGNREEDIQAEHAAGARRAGGVIRRWPDNGRCSCRSGPSFWRLGRMRILITGGAGFLGSALANRLVAEGHTVLALDDLTAGDPRRLDPECSLPGATSRMCPSCGPCCRVWTVCTTWQPGCGFPNRSTIPATTTRSMSAAPWPSWKPCATRASGGWSLPRRERCMASRPISRSAKSQTPNPNSPYGVSKVAAEHYVSTLGDPVRDRNGGPAHF